MPGKKENKKIMELLYGILRVIEHNILYFLYKNCNQPQKKICSGSSSAPGPSYMRGKMTILSPAA